MITIPVMDKEEYEKLVSRLNAGDSIAREKMGAILALFEENTKAVAKLQDELQEMPGGYRNSQDIKHLKGRIENLEQKLRSGTEVTVHSRLNDMEICIKEMSKVVDQNTECCKNVVASGKELEKRIEFLEAQGRDHNARMVTHSVRIEKIGECVNKMYGDQQVVIHFKEKLKSL